MCLYNESLSVEGGFNKVKNKRDTNSTSEPSRKHPCFVLPYSGEDDRTESGGKEAEIN